MSFADESLLDDLDDQQSTRFVDSVTNVLMQISDIWQRNVPKMLSDQQRCDRMHIKLRELHKNDLKTIESSKTAMNELQAKLNSVDNENHQLLDEIKRIRLENKELKLQLEHAADDYNVLNSKCTQIQKELENRKSSETKLNEESTQLLAQLQDANERISELESKITSDHVHFQQIIDEHTQKFLLEKQKAMQKLVDDHKQEIRKYLETIEERDHLFERSMKEADESLKEMRLKRDEYLARWQKSESDKELFRKKTEMKYKGLVAKGCYQMMTSGFPGDTDAEPRIRDTFTSESPERFPGQMLQELRMKRKLTTDSKNLSEASVFSSINDNSDNNDRLSLLPNRNGARTMNNANNADRENRPPDLKMSRRRSVSTSREKPRIVFEKTQQTRPRAPGTSAEAPPSVFGRKK